MIGWRVRAREKRESFAANRKEVKETNKKVMKVKKKKQTQSQLGIQ